jgi:RNA polymerase sigma factor for flagellar operon FliA
MSGAEESSMNKVDALSNAEPATPTAEDISAHMHLVHRIAAYFARRLPKSVQREDLVAAGTLGLFYALRSSEHTCPEMFASYARIRIRGAIVDELRRNDWAPRRRKVRNDAAPGGAQVIPLVPVRPAAIQVIGFDDLPPTTTFQDEGDSPFVEVEAKFESNSLREAVAMLPEREREIIRMRYFDGSSSKAIAQKLQLSEARVSQLHARATGRLREILSGAEMELAA